MHISKGYFFFKGCNNKFIWIDIWILTKCKIVILSSVVLYKQRKGKYVATAIQCSLTEQDVHMYTVINRGQQSITV